MAKVLAAIAVKNSDDEKPWFIVRRLPPPMGREVRLCWSDGMISTGSLGESGWTVWTWSSHRVVRTDAPVGWKALRVEYHDSSWSGKPAFPEA